MLNVLLFLSMAATETKLGGDKTIERLSESLNLSVSQAGLDSLVVSESKGDKLKAAFLLFCKRDLAESVAVVQCLFPPDHTPAAGGAGPADCPLDKLVTTMSCDLIDDFPASDPRWMQSVPEASVGSTMSILILHQLRDKQTAHEFYVSFLKEVGLWQRVRKR